MKTDEEAYLSYPKLRKYHNKLWLSESLGYNCGPGGISPCQPGFYITRPVINLRGMGLGAKKEWIDKNDCSKVPPGHFWCEFFEGRQFSATFQRESYWKQISCFKGEKSPSNLTEFKSWKRTSVNLEEQANKEITKEIWEAGIELINIEFIETRIIEIHLRPSPDPDFDSIIPLWESDTLEKKKNLEQQGFKFTEDKEDADGFLQNPRLGFLVK